MRWPMIAVHFAAACSNEANHVGHPFLLPLSGMCSIFHNGAYSARRARVEVYVKSNFAAMQQDIVAGGGPTLSQAFDVAGVPLSDRPARVIQLQADMGLYHNAPSALVTALMVYSA